MAIYDSIDFGYFAIFIYGRYLFGFVFTSHEINEHDEEHLDKAIQILVINFHVCLFESLRTFLLSSQD